MIFSLSLKSAKSSGMSAEVQDFMTQFPDTIGVEQTIAKAEEMMNEYGVRHLPVLQGGKLVAVVSNHDILLMKGFKDVDTHKVTLEEASTQDPYFVQPDAPISEVANYMADNKFSCALVLNDDKLVGIFSWVDGLRALAKAHSA